MKTYKAMYRCRLCGKAFYNGPATGENVARAHLFGLVARFEPMMNTTVPRLLETHDCGKPFESMGLADFIGWDEMEVD